MILNFTSKSPVLAAKFFGSSALSRTLYVRTGSIRPAYRRSRTSCTWPDYMVQNQATTNKVAREEPSKPRHKVKSPESPASNLSALPVASAYPPVVLLSFSPPFCPLDPCHRCHAGTRQPTVIGRCKRVTRSKRRANYQAAPSFWNHNPLYPPQRP